MSETLKELDWETLVCFVKGLVAVAKVDGIQPGERDYIEAFFQEETNHIQNPGSLDFDTIASTDFNIEEAKPLLNTDDVKRFFLKSCVMLACIDYFSDDERKLINDYSYALNVTQENLEEIILEVQNEIMAQFKDIKIYTDSLQEIAERIGLKNHTTPQ